MRALTFANITRRSMLLILIITGIVCGLAAVAFHWLVDLMTRVLLEPALEQRGVVRTVVIIAIPALVAAMLALAMGRFAPMASGANLARVRRAYAQDPAILDGRSVSATLIGTPLSLGSGAPLGPEGPTVVISSGLAIAVARLLRLPKRMMRGMIPVGTAAGIAAIFNTPITGVVFAMEEVMGSASKGVLGGTIVAAVAAAVVERMILGGDPILRAPSGTWESPFELAGFLLVGVIAGLVSGAATRLLIRVRSSARKRVRSSVFRAAAGGALVGCIGLFIPSVLGVGYDTTSLFLRGGGSFAEASLAFGGKVIAGMGAFFAGLLRVPIASVLIVFEVTGDYGLILPLMLAVAISTSLSRLISPHTLTETQMVEEGWRGAPSSDPLSRAIVSDAMSRQLVLLSPDVALVDVAANVAQRHNQYPVVDRDGRLLGLLHGAAIGAAVRDGDAAKTVGAVVEAAKLVVSPRDSINEVMRKMRDAGVDRCPVVDEEKRVVGFLSPSDMIRLRLRAPSEDDTIDRHFDRLIG